MSRLKCRLCRQWMHTRTSEATPKLRAAAPDADVCTDCVPIREARREDREKVMAAVKAGEKWEEAMKPDTDALREGHRLQSEVYPPRADANDFGPLYYGWAIMEAFLAGVEFERKRMEHAIWGHTYEPGANGKCKGCEAEGTEIE